MDAQVSPVCRPGTGLLVAMWLLSWAVYGAYFQGQWVYGERPIYHITGDEPHYLVVATTVLRYHALDVLNTYRDKDYLSFYPYHLGDPRDPEDMHALYGRGGHLYSKHGLALSLLVLPAFALGGAGLVTVFLMALTAALSVLIFLVALETSRSRLAAVVAWLAVAFSAPLLLYADQIYPEVPGALLTLLGARALLGERFRMRDAALVGIVIGLLPWFHLRYIPLAGVLALGALARLLRMPEWRRSISHVAPVLLIPALVGGAALLALDWRLFGGVPRVDEYGSVSLTNVLTGGPGLLVDQQYGLLVYAPIYLMALYGLPLVPRALGGTRAAIMLGLVVVYFGFIATFSFWFGAFSPPSRMLVPIVPLLVVPLALALARWRSVRFWSCSALLLLLGWGIAHLLMDVPRLRYNLWDGQSLMLLYLSGVWGRSLVPLLPSFVMPTAAAYFWVGAAARGAAGLWVGLTWRVGSWPKRPLPRREAASIGSATVAPP